VPQRRRRSPVAARALDWLTLIYDLSSNADAVRRPPRRLVRPATSGGRGPPRGALDGRLPGGELLVADPKRGASWPSRTTARRVEATRWRSAPRRHRRARQDICLGCRIRIDGQPFPAGRKAGTSVRRIECARRRWAHEHRYVIVLDTREASAPLRRDPAIREYSARQESGSARSNGGGPRIASTCFDTRQNQILLLEAGKALRLQGAGGPPRRRSTALAVDALGTSSSRRRLRACSPGLRTDAGLAQINAPAGASPRSSSPARSPWGQRRGYVLDSRKEDGAPFPLALPGGGRWQLSFVMAAALSRRGRRVHRGGHGRRGGDMPPDRLLPPAPRRGEQAPRCARFPRGRGRLHPAHRRVQGWKDPARDPGREQSRRRELSKGGRSASPTRRATRRRRPTSSR